MFFLLHTVFRRVCKFATPPTKPARLFVDCWRFRCNNLRCLCPTALFPWRGLINTPQISYHKYEQLPCLKDSKGSYLFQPFRRTIILGIQPLVFVFFSNLQSRHPNLLGCKCCWLMMGCWLIARSLIWGISGFDGDATTSRAFKDFKVAQIQTWRWNLNSLVGGFKRFYFRYYSGQIPILTSICFNWLLLENSTIFGASKLYVSRICT